MSSVYIDGIECVGCAEITDTKQGNVIPLQLPTQDSSSNETVDLLGVTRVINLSGIAGMGETNTTTFLTKLESICNGNQSSSVTLTYTLIDGTNYSYSIKLAQKQIRFTIPSSTVEWSMVVYEGD